MLLIIFKINLFRFLIRLPFGSLQISGNNRTKRSSDTRDPIYDPRDNNESLEPNWDDLYYEPENDFFDVRCVDLGADKITLVVSLRTALGLARVYLTRTKDDFVHYGTALCWQMKQQDDTCWGGNIATSDRETMANVIYDHFNVLKDAISSMLKNKNHKSIRIETNRSKSEFSANVKDEF